MLILYFIFCLTLPLLIPFIAHTVSLMGHRAVKQERFIVARDEEVWKLWAIYWRWRAVYKSISVDQAGPALAAARLVTDYTSCQLEARSQGSIPPPISHLPSPPTHYHYDTWYMPPLLVSTRGCGTTDHNALPTYCFKIFCTSSFKTLKQNIFAGFKQLTVFLDPPWSLAFTLLTSNQVSRIFSDRNVFVTIGFPMRNAEDGILYSE